MTLFMLLLNLLRDRTSRSQPAMEQPPQNKPQTPKPYRLPKGFFKTLPLDQAAFEVEGDGFDLGFDVGEFGFPGGGFFGFDPLAIALQFGEGVLVLEHLGEPLF